MDKQSSSISQINLVAISNHIPTKSLMAKPLSKTQKVTEKEPRSRSRSREGKKPNHQITQIIIDDSSEANDNNIDLLEIIKNDFVSSVKLINTVVHN